MTKQNYKNSKKVIFNKKFDKHLLCELGIEKYTKHCTLTQYTVQRTNFTVQRKNFTVQRTNCTVQLTSWKVISKKYIVQRKNAQYNVQIAKHNIKNTQYNVQISQHYVQIAQYNVQIYQ